MKYKLSSYLVASSKISMAGFFNSALAIAILEKMTKIKNKLLLSKVQYDTVT